MTPVRAVAAGKSPPPKLREEGPLEIAGEDISRPPSALEVAIDVVFRRTTLVVAWASAFLVLYLVADIGRVAAPAVRSYGLGFLTGTTWDANRSEFGILPAIFGTLYSSVLGLAIGTLFGLAIAIFLSERFLSSGLDAVLRPFGLSERPWWARLP